MSLSLSLLPAYAGDMLVCIRPSCTAQYPRLSRSEPGRVRVNAPPWRGGDPPPQGSSLGSGLCCPGPSSLNRPHPPHSQAHRDFTARRLIRDAFAVRERRGDPRVVPGFHYHSFLTCRPFNPGELQRRHGPVLRREHGLRQAHSSSALPIILQSVSRRGSITWLYRFAYATACQVARPPMTDQTRSPRPRRAFTSRLPTGRSPFLPLDMTTTVFWTPSVGGTLTRKNGS